MHHSFDVEEATRYGLEKAILITNLRFWLTKNKANNRNENEGYFWTYNSSVAFAKLFPYMKERSIRKWLGELEDEGVVMSGSFNKSNYDRTKWYTLPNEFKLSDIRPAPHADGSVLDANGSAQNCPPIPDIVTDVNTDVNNKKEEAVFSKSKEAVESIYKLYPVRCQKRNASTGKSRIKNQTQIRKLLKEVSQEDLTKTINRYLLENEGQQYLQNFTTFLNNVPDFGPSTELPFQDIAKKWIETEVKPKTANVKQLLGSGYTELMVNYKRGLEVGVAGDQEGFDSYCLELLKNRYDGK